MAQYSPQEVDKLIAYIHQLYLENNNVTKILQNKIEAVTIKDGKYTASEMCEILNIALNLCEIIHTVGQIAEDHITNSQK